MSRMIWCHWHWQCFSWKYHQWETPDLDIIDRYFLINRPKYIKNFGRIWGGSNTRKRIDRPLGIVLEIYPGKHLISRIAKLETPTGERIRPCQRLYQFEISTRTDSEVLERAFFLKYIIQSAEKLVLHYLHYLENLLYYVV